MPAEDSAAAAGADSTGQFRATSAPAGASVPEVTTGPGLDQPVKPGTALVLRREPAPQPQPTTPQEQLETFAKDLRELRAQAGLGYPEMAELSHYTMKTLASAAGGLNLPTLPVTMAYVRACDGNVAEWEDRWHRLADVMKPASHGSEQAGGPDGRPEPGRDGAADRLAADEASARKQAASARPLDDRPAPDPRRNPDGGRGSHRRRKPDDGRSGDGGPIPDEDAPGRRDGSGEGQSRRGDGRDDGGRGERPGRAGPRPSQVSSPPSAQPGMPAPEQGPPLPGPGQVYVITSAAPRRPNR